MRFKWLEIVIIHWYADLFFAPISTKIAKSGSLTQAYFFISCDKYGFKRPEYNGIPSTVWDSFGELKPIRV
ncbi:MAG: hypothetical protein EBT90_03705 [Rhodobacteraceae bacterium]|nr:hypothetical protein [Paracoccaceae bacterium]